MCASEQIAHIFFLTLIHTFRLKRDEVGIENKLENKYPLYAFTRDKKIAARFMREFFTHIF